MNVYFILFFYCFTDKDIIYVLQNGPALLRPPLLCSQSSRKRGCRPTRLYLVKFAIGRFRNYSFANQCLQCLQFLYFLRK